MVSCNKSFRFSAALITVILLCLPLFGGCAVRELSTLRAFAKPYEGTYRCEYAHFGEKDLLEDYREIALSLSENTFELTLVPRKGSAKNVQGSCEYGGGDTLTLRTRVMGKNLRKDLPFSGGKIFLEQSFAGKKLVMRFAMKV